jgi:hypothetical protein
MFKSKSFTFTDITGPSKIIRIVACSHVSSIFIGKLPDHEPMEQLVIFKFTQLFVGQFSFAKHELMKNIISN